MKYDQLGRTGFYVSEPCLTIEHPGWMLDVQGAGCCPKPVESETE